MTGITYPCRERIHAPLARALQLLEPATTSADAGETLAEARRALDLLEGLMTPAAEVLAEFCGSFGRMDSFMSEASRLGRNNGKHVAELTVSLTQRLKDELAKVFADLAPTEQAAAEAMAGLERNDALIRTMFDSAQKDGWKHGDYRTGETDDAEAAVAKMVLGAARY